MRLSPAAWYATAVFLCSACGNGRQETDASTVRPTLRPVQASVVREWLLQSDSLAGMASMATDPEAGLLAALDLTLGMVAIFDATRGTLLHLWGGRGDGPGQLRCGSAVRFTAAGVSVLDHCRNQLVSLSYDGTERQRVLPPAAPPLALSSS